jgi:internalin A
MCEEAGNVSDPEHFLRYLHECGLVYHRPRLLDGSIILDQEWALEAIYTIFNREKCWRQLRQLRGRFTRSLLETLVWDGYDSKEQELFLDLMKQAGICFVHRKEDGKREIETEYVAPDLLPAEHEVAEELQAYWKEGPGEERVIDFPFEYPGLVRNVIAKVGQHAGANAVYWKNGVCAYDRNSGSYARIDAFPSESEEDYGIRLRIRTQQGRAKEVLENLVRWVADEARNCGCKDAIAKEEDPPKPRPGIDPKGKARAAGVTEEHFQPAFEMPPRTAETTYCVSYAWTEESSKTVDQLCEDALSRGIEVIRDKTHLGLGERISKFMQRLGKGDRVFVILSGKYLQSPYCMFELFEIWRQSKQDDEEFMKRIRVYRLPDAKIATIAERVMAGVYWKQQLEEIDALVKEHGASVIGAEDFKRYKLMRDFALHVGDILGLVMDTLQPTSIEQLEDFGFEGGLRA